MGTRKTTIVMGPETEKRKKKWLEPHSKASEMVNARIPRN